MTDIHRIDAGPRLSEMVICGDRIYTSGVIAEEARGQSVLAQTRDVLQQIDAMLARAGSEKTRIVKANIWLADITTAAQMNQAWDAWVVPGQTPVRATVEGKLVDPSYAVEIMIEAVI